MQDSLAKSFDIPTPVGYRASNTHPDGKKSLINTLRTSAKTWCYMGNLAMDETTNFYRNNMERLGWEISDFSSDNEGLLFCRKSRKSCAISIRAGSKKTKIHIFLHGDADGVLSAKSRDINSKELVMLS